MWWRRVLAAVAVLAVPTGALAAYLVPALRPATAQRPGDDEAMRVLLEADTLRRAGFASPATADPSRWYDARCSCLEADRAQLAALARRGHALVGPGARLVSVRVVAYLPAELVLDVVDRIPPYVETDAAGRVLRQWPGRGDRQWRVVLVRGKITNWRSA